MKQYSAGQIKNIALAGHGGSGKTTIAEALLFITKATDRHGKVTDGNTVMDFDSEEIKRKVSVLSSVAPFEWKNCKINLLDTPGLFDFAAGFYEGCRAADTILIAVSGKSGVSVGAEKAYKYAAANKKPRFFYVSKLDTDNSDFSKVLAGLKDAFGTGVCPVIVPVYENRQVTSYVDLINQKAWKYTGAKASEIPMSLSQDELDEMILALSEAIAETDDALMEKFFGGEPFTQDELKKGLRKGIANGIIAPVFCGSALTLEAVDLLLDGIVELMPSAAETAPETATDANGDTVEIKIDENQPLAAFVFKTVADPFVGKMSFVKVASGKIKSDTLPVNSRTGDAERLGKLIIPRGKKAEDTDCVLAGDIAAISKLSGTMTGDTLCDAKRIVSIKPAEFPAPCLSMAIKAKAKGDEGKISTGMQRLTEEDLTLKYTNNMETHQQVISGLGEQHLDVVLSKLKTKFGVEVSMEKPRVPYRETIRKKVKVQGKHKKQSGGHGQFGDVWIEFEPCDAPDLEFAETVFGGSVPRNFFPAVEKGLRDSITQGVLAGYPVVGLRATLVDGSYHPVDSSEMSFKMAASIAYKNGLAVAGPVLLEPIGSLKVYAPDSNTGDIIGELNKRRGRVLGMNPDNDNLQLIEAEVPMSEMHDFATALRSIAQGRGHFALDFLRYEQLPQMLEAGVIEEAKEMNAKE